MRPYETLSKKYIDHGHQDIHEEILALADQGETLTKDLDPEQQDYLRLAFPVYEEKNLSFLN